VLRFNRDQILRFLRALDAALDDKLEIFVVGGLAAILKYKAAVKTSDMDVAGIMSGHSADLIRASRVASETTGLALSVSGATVTELPYNYEDRLKCGLKLKKLVVIVPDKYDLALSKMLRGDEHDLEAIASIHEQHRFSEKTLAQRFEKELWDLAMGDKRTHALTLLPLMELLYGPQRAEIYKKRWGLDKPRP
jgi:hypothetical protein